MVGESWDVFIKQVLVEKHIIRILFENTGGMSPSANAHKSSNFFMQK